MLSLCAREARRWRGPSAARGSGGLAAGPTARRRPVSGGRRAAVCVQEECHAKRGLSSGRAREVARTWARCATCPFVGRWKFLAYCVVGPPYPPFTPPRPGVSTPRSAPAAYPQHVVGNDAAARAGTQRASARNGPTTRAWARRLCIAPCVRAASLATIIVVSSPDSCYGVVVVRNNTATRGQRNDSSIR